MTKQQPLFDKREGTRQREDAIKRVERHAVTDWKAAADIAVTACAKRLDYFTTDDVVMEMPADGPATHEPRALGAVMRKSAADGIIAATESWRLSKIPSCHRRPKRVWASLIYRE